MPRIAATLAGLLLMGVSIGVNIARYPVVWEMVAAAPTSAQAEPAPDPDDRDDPPTPLEPPPAATLSEPTPDAVEPSSSLADHFAPPKPIPLEPVPDYQPDRYACVPALSESGSGVAAEVADTDLSGPAEAHLPGGTGALEPPANAMATEGTRPEPADSGKALLPHGRLVPVIHSTAGHEPNRTNDLVSQTMVALPPVDASLPPEGHLAESRAGEVVPFYPSTGVD